MSKKYKVGENEAGKRLDLFLVSKNPERSRGYFQKLVEQGLISVEGKTVKASQLLQEGEEVVLQETTENLYPEPENQPLFILYEDDAILVINKPAGVITHPNDSEGRGTVVNALLNYQPTISQAVLDQDSSLSRSRAGIVHRLDKDTSGVMVIAKTAACLTALTEQFRNHTTQKIYIALLYGEVKGEQEVNSPIQRKPGRGVMSASHNPEQGREAHTVFKSQQLFTLPHQAGSISRVICQITTGRTHQIRVHAKYIGHPVVGDPLYTTKTALKLNQRLQVKRQMLHASSLALNHPVTGERMTFTAPLAADIAALLTQLEQSTS